MKVTRSIMILKPNGYQSQSESAPASPAGSTPPVSPFSGKVYYLNTDSGFLGSVISSLQRLSETERGCAQQ
ncbi:hypothetical protein L195_g044715 [Trifolium pratense]|uniref:Uncharacterized protein n=1 Tax=Trifolium pratense TaxID=57577 RepID=A0A2K3MCW8_TRIPR|nr:hypothetical protein L195_g044715 [Trifolium pratense]